MTTDRLTKWRMILGRDQDSKSESSEGDEGLSDEYAAMDAALEALYDTDKTGGLGGSAPAVNRWLGDIHAYFPKPAVQMLHRDALKRLKLYEILNDPDTLKTIQPDVHLAASLLSLRGLIPAQTRDTARQIIRKLVKDLEERLREPVRSAAQCALQKARRKRHAHPKVLDLKRTVMANLSQYQPEFQTIIPEKLYGFESRSKGLQCIQIILDQSGSMTSSSVYTGILASILASVPSITTQFIAFDTSVVDLTDSLNDPVELLFGINLGGGTDICKALEYGRSQIRNPQKTTLVLISDLFDGASKDETVTSLLATIKKSGVRVVVLPALNDEGSPDYNHELAADLAQLSIPVFACTPDQFPGLMAAALNGEDFNSWLHREAMTPIA